MKRPNKLFYIILVIFPILSLKAYSNPCACDNSSACKVYDSNNDVEFFSAQDGWSSYKNITTGGEDGYIYTVTNTNDRGEGSLREGLEADCPLWIKFDIDKDKPIITLDKEIRVKSNKTLDGRGHNIRINTNTKITNEECEDPSKGDITTHGLILSNVENIIITHINFDDDFERWEVDCEGSDAIQVNNSKRIWIYHNSFSRWSDGAIDVNEGSDKITISWNRFEDINQAIALRSGRISFHHNYCKNIHGRCPKVTVKYNNNVRVHAYNNVIKDWGGKEIVAAVRQNDAPKEKSAELRFEYSIFIPGDAETVGKFSDSETLDIRKTFSKDKHFVDIRSNGSVEGDWISKSKKISHIEKCKDDDCFKSLRSKVRHAAGHH